MDELGIDQPVEVVDVQSDEQANEKRFIGSPTIRINGLDVDRNARGVTDYGLRCRIYQTEKGLQGWPSKKMVLSAFKEAI
ncbi:MAG: DUF2703 domain-containing protein [Actinobacteria bacterium]|nr:DUF2703 domain-containing protein [Actinomycetota bacterium]